MLPWAALLAEELPDWYALSNLVPPSSKMPLLGENSHLPGVSRMSSHRKRVGDRSASEPLDKSSHGSGPAQ